MGHMGSRSYGGHRLDKDHMIKDGKLLDTLARRGDGHMYYSSSHSDRQHDHSYHPYRRSDRGYFSAKFKKEKAPTFDGEMKKS